MNEVKELTEAQKAVASYLEAKINQTAQLYQQAKDEFRNYVSACATNIGIDFQVETWNYINGRFEKVENDAKSHCAESSQCK